VETGLVQFLDELIESFAVDICFRIHSFAIASFRRGKCSDP
jgi:hypothetical protein